MTQAANNSFQKHKYTFNICKLSIYTTVMFILKKNILNAKRTQQSISTLKKIIYRHFWF